MIKKIFFKIFNITAIVVLFSFLPTLSASACSSSQETTTPPGQFVPVPDTLVNENIPPIPIEIKQKMEQYSALKSASFAAFDTHGKGIIISSRFGDTSQLYLLDKPLGKLKQLTDFPEPVRNAYYSPDAAKNYFLFLRDVGGAENYQVFKYDLETGGSVQLTDSKWRYQDILYNTKGDCFAYACNCRNGTFFDVYMMNPEKPAEARMVFQAEKSAYYSPSAWFGNDRFLVIVENLSANEFNTLIVDTVSGKVENITPKSEVPQTFAMYEATADGKYLFGISDNNSEYNRLVRFERASGKITVLSQKIPWDVGSDSSSDITLSHDGKTIAFIANEDGISRLYLLDTTTLEYKPVTCLPIGVIENTTFDSRDQNIFMTIATARMNADVFQYEIGKTELVRWTVSDTAGLDLASFVEPKLIHFPTFDKVDGKPRNIPAFYFQPIKKSNKPFPVVINMHGGPEGQSRPNFDSFNSYLVNELGIAVIMPNVRGSTGYGKNYLMLDNAEKREDSVKDIGALLDWIAAQPELDKNRVAVYGGSYGGYMVLASLVHYSDRLACGVDVVGISNFVTFLKNTADYRRDLRRVEYGDERKIADFLNKISPTTNMAKIKKPLFVIQGKNDPRVPYTEAEQIVKAVRQNNIPVWYQLAVNEGHGFKKKTNRDFMNYSIVAFYKEFLLK